MKKNTLIKLFVFFTTASVICFFMASFLGKTSGLDQGKTWEKVIDLAANNPKALPHNIEYHRSFANKTELSIKTVSADVEIASSPDEQVHIDLVGAYPQVDAKNQAAIEKQILGLVDEGTSLSVELGESPAHLQINNLNYSFSQFKVSVPASAVVKIDSTSGDIKLEIAKIKELVINSISGNQLVSGWINQGDLQSVSGDIQFTSKASSAQALDEFKHLSIKTTSGDVKLFGHDLAALPIEMQTLSGEITSDHEHSSVQNKNKRSRADQASANVDKRLVEIKTVSGDILIQSK